MGQGSLNTRAAIHGIFINTLHSLFTLPQVQANGKALLCTATHYYCSTLPLVLSLLLCSISSEEVMKSITLKLVEFSQAKFYLQFGKQITFQIAYGTLLIRVGLQNTKASVESAYTCDMSPQSSQQYEVVKDTLFSTTTVAMVEHLHETVNTMRDLFPDSEWHLRWQKLARR